MKYYSFVLTILLLLIAYSICSKNNDDVKEKNSRQKNSRGSKNDSIVYPCSTNDIKCIRRYFSTHSRCKPTNGSVPESFIIDRLTFPMSTSNISSTIRKAKITDLNGKISSFYINRKTDNLVIAFEAINLTLSSPGITFVYNRKGKEPIKLTDYFTITYSSATFTATIPNIDDIQLADADVYAFLDDGDPTYRLGPGLSRSCNPIVLKAYYDLVAKIPANGKESLVIQAPNFMKIYIQHTICNFGLKIEF